MHALQLKNIIWSISVAENDGAIIISLISNSKILPYTIKYCSTKVHHNSSLHILPVILFHACKHKKVAICCRAIYN